MIRILDVVVDSKATVGNEILLADVSFQHIATKRGWERRMLWTVTTIYVPCQSIGYEKSK